MYNNIFGPFDETRDKRVSTHVLCLDTRPSFDLWGGVSVSEWVPFHLLNAGSLPLRKRLTHECCISECVSQSYVGKSKSVVSLLSIPTMGGREGPTIPTMDGGEDPP